MSEITLDQIPEAQLFKVIVKVKVVKVKKATTPLEQYDVIADNITATYSQRSFAVIVQ